jgi:hypothetical protein
MHSLGWLEAQVEGIVSSFAVKRWVEITRLGSLIVVLVGNDIAISGWDDRRWCSVTISGWNDWSHVALSRRWNYSSHTNERRD